MLWFIIGSIIGFLLGIRGTLEVIRFTYPHIYTEFENGEWKIKYYNAKAKESRDDNL